MTDLAGLITRLGNYNPPDRTADEYRQTAQDILDAKAAIEQLQAELAREKASRRELHEAYNEATLAPHWLNPNGYNELLGERDALRAELEAVKRKIDELFPVIAHGDDKHRAWLKDAIEKHFDAARAQGDDKPPPDSWYEPSDGRRLAEHNKDK